MSKHNFAGKSVFITGAGSGIGYAVALAFAGAGREIPVEAVTASTLSFSTT
jgi:NAD(P)-dependent dehydrogenase (short-subunit alcohol dehydrogenase family)